MITDALESVPAGPRRTLTWDQGKELAQPQQITVATGTALFFATRTRGGSGAATRT